MFGKLKELMDAKGKMEEVKKRLESVLLTGESMNKEVSVTVTGGRKVVKIAIHPSIFNVREKEEIENLILIAVNHGLDQADHLMAEEMKRIMPDIPGLGMQK